MPPYSGRVLANPFLAIPYAGGMLVSKEFVGAEVLENMDPNNYRRTPTSLHTAAEKNDVEMARALIARGEDVNEKEDHYPDGDGDTPLILASYSNSINVARLLVEAGADIDAQNWGKSTALEAAFLNDSLEVARFLMEIGASGVSSETVLHKAALSNSIKIVRLLIDTGADIDARLTDLDVSWVNNIGNSPLHSAVRGSALDTMRMLIDAGADIQARNDQDETPLSIAAEKRHHKMVDMLIEHGAITDGFDLNWMKEKSVNDSARSYDLEDIVENGVDVIDIEYSTDNPGVGAGIESVTLHAGRYWFKSEQDDPAGPYASAMDAVIDNELNMINPTVDTITTRDADAKEFESVLKGRYDTPFTIVLNGKTITVNSGD
ncbi:ankyrin repeat domain-containing protein [Candidatus Lucifugimonas marina]